MWKAFQGEDGHWYVSWEMPTGWHLRPKHQRLTREAAEALVLEWERRDDLAPDDPDA